MELKTLYDFRVSKEPSGVDWAYIEELRQEAINWIKTIKKCKVNANDVNSFYSYCSLSAEYLKELFPDFEEPRINDIDTMVFIIKKIFNITDKDLKEK